MSEADRKAFEEWYHGPDDEPYNLAAKHQAWKAWLAATARERERCAKIADNYGNADFIAAAPVIRGNTVEATGLTKREWLMAHFPISIELIGEVMKEGSLAEVFKQHAIIARDWADAIIKEAVRDGT